jgi:hypothetical protein
MNVKIHSWLTTPKGKLVQKKVSATEARLEREKDLAILKRAKAINRVPEV